jgi:hypothetical protein
MQQQDGRAPAGPSSAYPTLNTPASTCFNAPNGLLMVISFSFSLIVGAVLIVVCRCELATPRAA